MQDDVILLTWTQAVQSASLQLAGSSFLSNVSMSCGCSCLWDPTRIRGVTHVNHVLEHVLRQFDFSGMAMASPGGACENGLAAGKPILVAFLS